MATTVKDSGRGKRLSLNDPDTPATSLDWSDVRLQQLVEAAKMLCIPESPKLRQAALATLRKAAEAWALNDRDRINQHGRRKGKPATSDDYDDDRNTRIRRRHTQLVAEDRHDATATVAQEFDLSPRQIVRIVRPKPSKR
jgi:hypothetical protein